MPTQPDAVEGDERSPDLPGAPMENRQAIQAAIDELSVDRLAAGLDPGGVVHLPAGRVALDAPLVLRSHVTLRGASTLATVLVGGPGTPWCIEHEPSCVGSTVEDLAAEGAGIRLGDGSSYCRLRRIEVRHSAGHGLEVAGDVAHLVVEELTVDDAGHDGIHLGGTQDLTAPVFLTAIAVGAVGLADGDSSGLAPAGLHLGLRVHVNQVFVGPVRDGQVGVRFAPGSDHSTVSPYHLRVEPGGVGFSGAASRQGITVGTGATEELPAP